MRRSDRLASTRQAFFVAETTEESWFGMGRTGRRKGTGDKIRKLRGMGKVAAQQSFVW
jgi:hypothetical protein